MSSKASTNMNSYSTRKTRSSSGRVKTDPRASRRSKNRRPGAKKATSTIEVSDNTHSISMTTSPASHHGERANAFEAVITAPSGQTFKALFHLDPCVHARLRRSLDKERRKSRKSHHRSVGNHQDLHGVLCMESSTIDGPVQNVGSRRANMPSSSPLPDSNVGDSDQSEESPTPDWVEAMAEVANRMLEGSTMDANDHLIQQENPQTPPPANLNVAPGWEDVFSPTPPPPLRRLPVFQELSKILAPTTPFDFGFPDPTRANSANIIDSHLSGNQIGNLPSHGHGLIHQSTSSNIWEVKAAQRRLENELELEAQSVIHPGTDQALDLEEQIFARGGIN
jgi:hypothetical protein